jgi:hypothetical protein
VDRIGKGGAASGEPGGGGAPPGRGRNISSSGRRWTVAIAKMSAWAGRMGYRMLGPALIFFKVQRAVSQQAGISIGYMN